MIKRRNLGINNSINKRRNIGMSNRMNLIMLLLAVVMMFHGCGTLTDRSPSGGNTPAGEDNSTDVDASPRTDKPAEEDAATFDAQVIEAGDHLLVTPDKDSSEYRSSDRISVGTDQAVMVNKDGEALALNELKPGDYLVITYSGAIAESYPAQIQADEIKLIGHNVLLDGYLALIDDIWQEDSGLNGDIEMIAFDTTGWTEQSEIEKEIIFAAVKEAYGYETLEGTFDELVEQGLIDKDNLYFPKGIQIVIGDMNYDEDKNIITCSIKKWRSGLGAIGSDEVTARFKEDKWEITKEGMWIS